MRSPGRPRPKQRRPRRRQTRNACACVRLSKGSAAVEVPERARLSVGWLRDAEFSGRNRETFVWSRQELVPGTRLIRAEVEAPGSGALDPRGPVPYTDARRVG